MKHKNVSRSVCYKCITNLCLYVFYILQDIEMHRGKPLFLNEERYAALTHMVQRIFLPCLMCITFSLFAQDAW